MQKNKYVAIVFVTAVAEFAYGILPTSSLLKHIAPTDLVSSKSI